MNKRIAIISATVLTVGALGGAIAMPSANKTGATTSPIVTEIDQHEDKLNNHEARIRNLEADTSALQASTGTAPAATKTAVPSIRAINDPTPTTSISNSAVAADPVVAAPTVVVTAYREIVIDPDTSDCEYTYSDGSTYRFAWKTSNPQGAWVTDGNGNNGHWQQTVNTHGFCDNRAIGNSKS